MTKPRPSRRGPAREGDYGFYLVQQKFNCLELISDRRRRELRAVPVIRINIEPRLKAIYDDFEEGVLEDFAIVIIGDFQPRRP